jgi:hypothetical protein
MGIQMHLLIEAIELFDVDTRKMKQEDGRDLCVPFERSGEHRDRVW